MPRRVVTVYVTGQPPCKASAPRLFEMRESRAYAPEDLEQLLRAAHDGAQAADPLADPFGGLFEAKTAQASEALLGNVDLAGLEKLCSASPNSYTVVRKEDSRLRKASSGRASLSRQPLMAVIPAKESADITFSSHSGQEFLHLVEGRLEVSLGDKVEVLAPGDSIYFNSRIPHALRGLDGGNAISIAIIII